MTAPTTANINITPSEGIDYAQTYTVSSSTPEYPNAPFPVGMHSLGSNGSEYIFVKASTAIRRWQAVAIDLTAAAAVPATKALANAQTQIGFAQAAIAASDYGWVALRGENIGVLARKGSLANVKLYVSNLSPGALSSTSVITSAYVSGIVLTTSCTSAMTAANSSAVVVAVATWPRTLT